ncbi:AAA family ATPase [Longispora fulva]|nr:AAA family ATPase [Longispora fulva]
MTRARYERADLGEPLPPVLKSLARAGVQHRRGQLALVAGAPGRGKSVVAQTLALGVAEHGLPVLYLCPDTDAVTMRGRMFAMLTGVTVDEADQAMARNPASVDEVLSRFNFVRWSFDTYVTTDHIAEACEAYAYGWGAWPALVVVDNVGNVADRGGGEDWNAWERTLSHLSDLAKTINAHVLALHHLTGEYDDGDKVPTLSALRGKVSKLPSLIMGVYTPYEGAMGFSVLKNRSGRASASGGVVYEMPCDFERMQLDGGCFTSAEVVDVPKVNYQEEGDIEWS